MDGAVGFLFKFFFGGMVTLFILTISGAVIQFGEKNDFKQYVNASIERHGGLTDAAVDDIEKYSADTFNGRFTILTRTEKKPYGEEIEYDYELKISPVFMKFEVIALTFNGTAASKVR